MAKHKQRQAASLAKDHPVSPAAGGSAAVVAEIPSDAPAPAALPLRRWLPLPLWILYGVVLAIGLGIGLSREARTRAAAYNALMTCDATVIPEADGLNDSYAIVQFNHHSEEVVHWLSLCEREPEMARSIFRQALDGGNKSARVVVLYSVIFLTSRAQLQEEDIKRILQRLDGEKERELDVRKAAQRALSDLTFITPAAQKARFETLPTKLPPPPEKSGGHRIQTRAEERGGQAGLGIRWSNPDLAEAWLKRHAAEGKWDEAQQLYVIGAAP